MSVCCDPGLVFEGFLVEPVEMVGILYQKQMKYPREQCTIKFMVGHVATQGRGGDSRKKRYKKVACITAQVEGKG